MLSFEAALAQLLEAAVPLQALETVGLLEASGRVLGASVRAAINVPSADNSAMDGYAVRVGDIAGTGARLPISQRIPAGVVPAALQPGTAARIFTGAIIPRGADAVVMQERCLPQEAMVTLQHLPTSGENIRRAGEDIREGEIVLHAGHRLTPASLGLAASTGIAVLPVMRRLRVAILFTGDELAEPGQPLDAGRIYNSNRYVLHASLRQLDCEVLDLGRVPDDLAATRAALRRAAQAADVVISSGGVSVGEEDHVKAAVEAEGRLEAWKIAIKPGKPLAFGQVGEAAFIGLPGNPVSAFVTFMTLVRPYLRKRQGEAQWLAPVLRMRADFSWTKADKRREFLRVRRNGTGGLELFAHQGSGVLSSCVWADGLVDNPPGTMIEPGDLVRYIPLEVR